MDTESGEVHSGLLYGLHKKIFDCMYQIIGSINIKLFCINKKHQSIHTTLISKGEPMVKNYEFTIKSAIIYTIIFFLTQMLMGFVLVFIYSIIYTIFNPDINPTDLPSIIKSSSMLYILIIIFTELIFFLFAIRIKNKYKNTFQNLINFKKINYIFLILVIFFSIAYIFPSSELENILAGVMGRSTEFSEVILKISQMPGISGLIISIFIVAVMPAFIEELLFRGLIQKNLCVKYGNTKGVLITAILFSIIHFNPSAVISILIVSLMFGYIYLKTDNLVYSIILHFCNNFINVILFRYNSFEIKGLNISIAAIEHVSWYLIIPITIITLLLTYVIIKFKYEKVRKGTY